MTPMKIILAFIIASAMTSANVIAQDSTAAHEVQVTAKKYEFNPKVITVKKGEHVKLAITAVDHDHGFKLEGFNLNQMIAKGATSNVEFTAEKAGTFEFHCSHFCGLGHHKMKGKLVVTE